MLFYKMMRFNAAKLEGDRNSTLDLARGRLVLLSAFFAVLYMILAVRVFDLSVLQFDWRGLQDDDYSITQSDVGDSNPVRRGSIFDRNGNLLASSLQMASLYVDPHLIAHPDDTAAQLIQIFPSLSYGRILRTLQSKKRFVWVQRNISPAQQDAVMQIGEPGLGFRYEYRRVYPNRNEFSHIAGMADVDGRGLAGVERSFDGYLSQGKDLHLTFDGRIQHALRRELHTAITEFDALGGAGVVIDVRTGEIIAGVSLPDFNPHDPSATPQGNLFNRLSLGVYELGSVFKIFSTAAFLEANKDISMGLKFDVSEPIKVGKFTISDYHPEQRDFTLAEVFMHSSNIGTARMAQSLGGDALREFYSELGLLSPLDVEIAETASPMEPDRWGDVATMTASYGHGIATTPLHAAVALATIVNGGYYIRPTVVKSDDGEAKVQRDLRVMSEETSYKMRELLRLVVDEGTGRNAAVPGYKVGGKTGTAEKSSASGGYDHKRLISSFAAAFPMDDPRYAVLIAVDEPKGNKKSFGYATAGWVSAPAVGRLIKSMVSILGIAPQYDAPDYEGPLKKYITVEG